MKKINLGNKGFTLVEILVAAGLIAGLSVAMMNIFKQQSFSQKKTEAGFELSTLQQSINTVLLNRIACKNTLDGIANIRAATNSITQIKDASDNVAFQTGISYGNLVEIQSINIKDPHIPPVDAMNPAINQIGDVTMEFNFNKTSKILENSPTKTKNEFKITVEVDSSNRVVNCYSAVDQAIDTSKKETCEALGGTFDAATNKCTLTPYVPTGPSSPEEAASTKFLEDYMNNFLINVLDPRYVNVAGDTMTGNLAMNGAGITISGGNLTQSSGFMSTDQYLTISDKRLKKKIKDISQEKLNQLHQIKTHEFVWRRDNRKDYGFIAQEIEKIFPELVITNPTTGYKAVQYVSLVPIMLEEVQQLRKENTALKEENEKMKKDIEEIKQHLNLK